MALERPRLQSLAYRLVDDSGEVPDVLQEVYLAAYRGMPKYRGDARLATWLYRITYNACLAHRARRPEVAETQPDVGPAHPDHAGVVAERLDLAAALAALPLEQRALVLMVDRDGFDYQAVAEALGVPLGTVARASRRPGRNCAGPCPWAPRRMAVRHDYDSLVEGQRRDLELGAALAALPQPELPDDMDARLRAAVEKERRRNRRRPGWPELLAVLLLAAVVVGALAWRYVPPRASTMGQVRSAIELRRDSLIPTPPQAAIARGRMTSDERDALERQVAKNIVAICTPRFALEQIVEGRAPQDAVQVSANALASGMAWPAPVARPPCRRPGLRAAQLGRLDRRPH